MGRKEYKMTNKTLSLAFMILAVGCLAAILFYFAPYFFLEKNGITLPFVIGALVICIIGVSAFVTSRSHARQARKEQNDVER